LITHRVKQLAVHLSFTMNATELNNCLFSSYLPVALTGSKLRSTPQSWPHSLLRSRMRSIHGSLFRARLAAQLAARPVPKLQNGQLRSCRVLFLQSVLIEPPTKQLAQRPAKCSQLRCWESLFVHKYQLYNLRSSPFRLSLSARETNVTFLQT
jgi:hypothetical protein